MGAALSDNRNLHTGVESHCSSRRQVRGERLVAKLAMALLELILLVLLGLLVRDPLPADGAWQTLSGKAPIVIANGGTSGLYPDQILPAYEDALNNSLPGVVISCDLQMSKSQKFPVNGTGICRKNLNLQNSTVIDRLAPELNNTYVVNGVSTFGWFAIDITYETLVSVAPGTQSVLSRSPAIDGFYQILKPEFISASASPPGILASAPQSTWWMNCEYTDFIETNSPFNATQYTIEAIQDFVPGYVSAPDINLLKKIQAAPNTNRSKLIYKFLDTSSADPSTNQSYTSLLQNLTFIRSFASGILVPKSLIWKIDPDSFYLQSATSLVQDAHTAKLEVYAYDFSNDQYPNSYNYTFDPITELLYYIERYNFSVDGIFTDFPATASEAISCYALNSRNVSSKVNESGTRTQVIISHDGNSGQYPGATTIAYESAIVAGVDYIDCTVQITADSVPICRGTPNLLETTDVANSAFFQSALHSYPDFNSGKAGVYTFDVTWAQVQTLKSVMYTPGTSYISRDPGYNGDFGILTLADVLSIAKNSTVGILIDIQNALFLRNEQNLAVVDTVVASLSTAGYEKSDKVILLSDESSVLTRLRTLGVTYPLMYQILWSSANPISLDESDFVQIKGIASSVSLDARIVEPYDEYFFLAGPPTDVITLAHQQNLTVYFQVQKNDPTAFPFDLLSDPTLQLFSLAHYGVDGIISDFPATVSRFQQNQCSGAGLQSSVAGFSIPLVVPGVISAQYTVPPPVGAPAPNLVIGEAPLAGLPVFAPAPSPVPAAASHLSNCFRILAFIVIVHLVAILETLG